MNTEQTFKLISFLLPAFFSRQIYLLSLSVEYIYLINFFVSFVLPFTINFIPKPRLYHFLFFLFPHFLFTANIICWIWHFIGYTFFRNVYFSMIYDNVI